MIDTHCHLDHCPEPAQAAASPLRAMVTIGTTLARSQQAIAFAERYPQVYASVGVHPTEAAEAEDAALRQQLAALASHPKVVAIGESGFDYYWDSSSAEQQRMSFVWQAELARSHDKPLILHVRDKEGTERASLETLEQITQLGWHKGILHCCNGHMALIEGALALGWYISFAGNLTYRKAEAIRTAAQQVPEERLLLETDSPYLAPVPKRGKKNTPAFIHYTAQALADVRGVSLAHIEAVTDANAIAVYQLPLGD